MFSRIPNPFARNSRPVATLQGHSGSVMAMGFSPNGKYLASGGSDGIMIWDTTLWRAVPVSKQSYAERAQASCLCWLTRRNEPVDTLCYGNVYGFLVFLQYSPAESRFEIVRTARIAQGQEIISIASRISGANIPRIALCTRDKCFQVWTFDTGSWDFSPVFSKLYPNDASILPRTVAFDNNSDHDIFIFGMYDGNLYKHNGNNGDLISRYQLSLQIGYAVVDPERRLCAVDNVGDGFNLYKLDTGAYLKTLTTKDPLKTHPKGVVFTSQSYFVVGGSDHGLVYIFDRKTGNIVTTLRYAQSGGAETITAHDTSDGSVLVAAGSSTSTGPCPIKIWKWAPTARQNPATVLSSKQIVVYLLKLAIFGAACAYFYEMALRQYNVRWNTAAAGSRRLILSRFFRT